MRARRAITAWRRRRNGGGILFEVVLALALFGGAAAFILSAVRSVYRTLDITQRQQEAVDLARSKLAELEAGLITLADLRSGSSGEENPGRRPGWTFDLKTSRTEFTGLTLVELTVREDLGSAGGAGSGRGGAADQSGAMQYTLRQLIALRQSQASEYEQDHE